MHRLLHIDLNNPTERNSWYLVLEIFWATFLGAAASFNAAFAIRLGATDTQVGLLTSLPALLAVLVLIPAGRFLNTRKNPKPWLLGSLALYRSGFLVVAIIPWLKFAGINQGALLVFWLVFLSLPVHFFNVGFIPLLSDVVPPSQRANVFTARNVIYNAALSVSVYLYGQWLNRVDFPINYQLMYVVSYTVALLSLYYLVKIQNPPKTGSYPRSGTHAIPGSQFPHDSQGPGRIPGLPEDRLEYPFPQHRPVDGFTTLYAIFCKGSSGG